MPNSHVPERQGEQEKTFQERLQKGSKESPEEMQEIRPPGNIWEDIWKNIHGREKQGSVERLFPICQPISSLDFVLCLKFRKMINTCICRV